MKRVADSQLTKDARDESGDEEETGSGFKKADSSVLSERKIRGLPKRAGLTTTSSPAPPDSTLSGSTQPASRFGGFGGFGASSSPSNPFAITGSQPLGSNPVTLSQPKAPPPSAQIASDSRPNVSGAKTSTDSHDLGSDAGKSEAARKYYLALRGINKSFIRSVTESIAADPFVDITEYFGKYKSFRESAQKEFETGSSINASQTNGSPSSSVLTSTTKSAFSLPTPPASFSFGLQPTVTSGEVPSGGFKPNSTGLNKNSTTSFSFGVKAAASPFEGFKPTSTGSTSTPDKPIAFSFGQDKPTNAPFVFGTSTPALNNTSDSKVTKAEEPKSTPPSTSPFSATPKPISTSENIFSASGKPSTSKVTKAEEPISTPPSTSPFSATPKSISTSENIFSASGKPTTAIPSPLSPSHSGFGFGTGKPSGSASPFGTPGNGSIGNPVGFAFASTSQTTEPQPVASTATTDPSDSAETGVPSEDSLPRGNPYDVDGPGEENESTVYQTKCSANKFALVDDKRKYVKAGTGLLKLKKHKETGKMRILMRNSSTGNIILNFNLHPGFNITVDKKDITFRVPGEGEDAAIYRLRLGTEADATKWPTVIREE